MTKAWTLPTDRIPSEQEEQQDLIRWFRRTYPGVRIFAIPNGEQRSKQDGRRLKNGGVSSGVPDLFSPALLLWIEMKATDGREPPPKQKDWHSYLRGIGHTVIVPYGSAEAQRMIAEFVSHHPRR